MTEEQTEKILEEWISQPWTRFLNSVKDYIDKRISNIELVDDEYLVLSFEDGKEIGIYDDGQSCCEARWMSCDAVETFDMFKGSLFLGVECLDETEEDEEDDGREDILFLRVNTDKGWFKIYMHNSHNGYYGGFSPSVKVFNE